MRISLAIFSILFLSACVSHKERAESFLKKNPQFLAEQCAINFPVVPKFIKGETKTDTVYKDVPGVEIPCPETTDESGNKYTPKVKCPDQEIIEIKEIRTDTVYLENTANVIRLRTLVSEQKLEITGLEEDRDSLKKELIHMYIGMVLLGVVLLLIGFKSISK